MVTTFVITLLATRFAAPLARLTRRGLLAVYFVSLNASMGTAFWKRIMQLVLLLNTRLIKSPMHNKSGKEFSEKINFQGKSVEAKCDGGVVMNVKGQCAA